MNSIGILLANGFEEAEAIVVIDVLSRLDIPVTKISCEPTLAVTSYHHVPVIADSLLADVDTSYLDGLIIPGGPQATTKLSQHQEALAMIALFDQQGKWICPICSAAARVLGQNRQLKGRHYVCSGGLQKLTDDGVFVDQSVVQDQNLLSGKGLGDIFDFAFALAEQLTDDRERCQQQRRHLYE